MNTSQLKKFAQAARRLLMEQVRAQMDAVLAEGSLARRESAKAVSDLENEIHAHGREQTVEKAAYIWFNRFTALMFMDVNNYTPVRVTIPADGETRPQILSDAMANEIDASLPEKTRSRIQALLSGEISSRDAQAEAYRLLLVGVCNHWHAAMPFMFERIADWTELLMPADLLSQTSVLARMREVMDAEACQDVEIIGWLYQFYISEKKDQVFDGLKKNVKITAENIPAATQLFTPHWIVRYLVENSLGRLWMLNRPASKLMAKMDYFIAPEEPEDDFLRIASPEDIRICDPACGSGHMLTYAFDLLYAIYEEEGYDPSDIPEKILTKNLYGIEIDDRAGALAAFALTMKARAVQARFFRRNVAPNICVLEDVKFTDQELADYIAEIEKSDGRDLFTADLKDTLGQFEQARNFGSLIVPKLQDVSEVVRRVDTQNFDGKLFLRDVHERVRAVLRMAECLSSKYHVVVANPPYIGGKGMNAKLAECLRENYADAKADVFAAFIVRNTKLGLDKAQLGIMSPFVWMFISSYEKLRLFLLEEKTITSLIQLEYSGFEGATVPICAFTVENCFVPGKRAGYVRLSDFRGHINQAPKTLEAIQNPACGWFFRASAELFKKIPGSPIAYWASEQLLSTFCSRSDIGSIAAPRQGLATSDNGRFLRIWSEVSLDKTSFNSFDHAQARQSGARWFPYNKGGSFRKWYGNNEFVVNWECDGKELLDLATSLYGSPTRTIKNMQYYFADSITWSAISSAKLSVRRSEPGFIFDQKGQCIFSDNPSIKRQLLGFLNSSVAFELLRFLSPTLDFVSGTIAKLPYMHVALTDSSIDQMISLTKSDWDAYEASWDFTTLPLLSLDHRVGTLAGAYARLRAHWRCMTAEMRRLEEDNNRIFIHAYGLQDELTPEVPLNEITLTCNPAYRYGGSKTEEELEALLCADTMREFVSYAVGCMFGRYSLDAPGLILTNQGEKLHDYLARVPQPSFKPDADNVLPILDGDWFPDDITSRFREFLTVTFGADKFQENLTFIEEALGKDIRRYFLRDFYKDHVKRYKKRPIYWLFSSPKGSFNALIYIHRYRADTVSVILNDYLRAFRAKLVVAHREHERTEVSQEASQREKTLALKEKARIEEILAEVDTYERDTLFPLASQKIEIDLDDGVKVNYLKFGDALAKIPGLEAKDDG